MERDSHYFSIEERVQMVRLYYETKNIEEVIRRFVGHKIPCRETVRETVDRFESTGSVADTHVVIKRRRSTTAEKAAEVEDHLIEHPEMGLRPRAQELGVSKTSLSRIIAALGYSPYRPRLLIDHTDEDFASRLECCTKFVEVARGDPTFCDNVWWTDECRFSLDRVVNTRNCIYYAKENPEYFVPVTHTKRGVMVWAAISSEGIIGPLWFEGSVTAESYIEMLRLQFLPEMRRRVGDRKMYFQQDGAAPHYAAQTRAFLTEHFGERWISRGGPLTWPARSPDLTPPDFFLWGWLKSKIYMRAPTTVEELRAAIETEMRLITVERCKDVCRSVVKRWEECIAAGGTQVRV